ncbi:MAG: L-alanine exporter AlaE [Pelagibaca sp.]
MKSYFIDTVATVIFFTVVAALSELLIAGMDLKQVLIARLITIPIMMVTGRPYGIWRDWFFSKTRPQRWIANVAYDIIAFITFQVPVYVTTLAVAGATASEIVAAVSASIVFMILLSRPFGIYLDAVRNWARSSVM